MTKKVERTGDPVIPAVPWNAPPAHEQVSPEQAAADAFEALGDDPIGPELPDLGPKEDSNLSPNDFAERIKAAFTGEPVKQASPFAPKPKAEVEAEPEIFDLGDAPSWGELVRFVQKHGNVIIQVRYPAPRGVAIDTLYRGVTVITHPTCELRHVTEGWIEWKDAQYE